jgi:hypothetical protein
MGELVEATKLRHGDMTVRFFLDTEFTHFIDLQLISIGIVGEDGSDFYGELSDYNRAACSEFVRAAVLPQLGQFPGRAMAFAQLSREVLAWLSRIPVESGPILCYDYADDFALLCDLIDGPLLDGWAHENIRARLDYERQEAWYREHGGRHHALHDARANAFAFKENANG